MVDGGVVWGRWCRGVGKMVPWCGEDGGVKENLKYLFLLNFSFRIFSI